LISTTALVSLTTVVLAGTISTALSKYIYGRTIMVGPTFYNNVLVPIGLVLLLTTAAAPLLRWGQGPTTDQKRCLALSACAGLLAVLIAWVCSSRHPMTMAVVGSSISALTALGCSLVLDARRRAPEHPALGVLSVLGTARRQYAGFLIHLSFFCMAIGVAGSSLGTRQQDVTLSVGDTIEWAGRTVRLARVNQQTFPDKLVVEAELDLARADGRTVTILPGQHFHRLNQAWTTEVAIDSTWRGDFYVILHSGEGSDRVELTLIDNPMMRWLWMGGWIAGVGTLIRLWPRRGSAVAAASSVSGRRTDSTAGRRAMAASLLIACALNGTVSVPVCAGTQSGAATADTTTD
jgi:cytochrome c-type biogenesis protein CcmF